MLLRRKSKQNKRQKKKQQKTLDNIFSFVMKTEVHFNACQNTTHHYNYDNI